MKRVVGVTALVALALVPLTGAMGQGPSAPPDRTPRGAVLAVSVTPGTGRADVVIAVDGTADVMDFKLDGGKRVVVDFTGATLGAQFVPYDKVTRAGITNIRYSQFRSDVVRIVLDLDAPREYTVVKGDHDVRISVAGPDAFAPWRAGSAGKATVTGVSLGQATAQLAGASPGALAKNFEEARFTPATPAPVKPGPSKPLPAKLTPEPSYAEPRITITLNDVHIRDVIERFAEYGGRTIVVGRTVDGFVNATIKDQPWDVALRQILTAQGLSAIEDSTGIISVDSYTNLADRAKVEPTATRIIAVNYAKAETMANTVRSLLTAGCSSAPANAPVGAPSPVAQAQVAQCASRGSVAFDEKTNTVIVTEIPSRLAEIESYVRDLDVRTPQVTIKAKLISVDRTGTEQLGLAYDLGSPNGFQQALVTRFNGSTPVPGDFRVNLSGDALAAVANAGRPYKGSAALSLLYNMTLGGFNLTSFIDALSSVQLTDVQAEPSTTTGDNKEAELFAGSQLSFLLTPPIIPGQIQSVAPQIHNQDIGVTLRVTPHVTSNRQVQLEIFAEEQTLQSVTTAGPNTNKRSTRNSVLVGDGETAVIGGLTQTQVSRSKTGIPFLMDLPGIGKLFSQTETVERKQDLLIMITPHIVDEGEAIRALPRKP